MGTGELNAGGNPVMDWHPIQWEVGIILVASCYKNRQITAGLMSHFARMQTSFTYCTNKTIVLGIKLLSTTLDGLSLLGSAFIFCVYVLLRFSLQLSFCFRHHFPHNKIISKGKTVGVQCRFSGGNRKSSVVHFLHNKKPY